MIFTLDLEGHYHIWFSMATNSDQNLPTWSLRQVHFMGVDVKIYTLQQTG